MLRCDARGVLLPGQPHTGAHAPIECQAMSHHESVSTDSAPAAIGPYSQGMRVGDLLYVADDTDSHLEWVERLLKA